ncbi:uncharacterized protein At1g24485-like [Macadamia integrifolia]|uniref:uncharacterized protein At1g24485-like n=1 Tax=Macadamia integrifolia TaxID=60698 RepID=UPI001C4E7945|nr:uncharacterized protein At1g24485-like [Macadamia integrifolia]
MANQLFFLLLSLLAIAASAQVFVSIDCGGSSNVYTDEKGIKWSGDDPFIQTGKNAVVQTSNSNSISHVMNTLRVFPTHNKKNCYSINATNGEKFLVRASFYYGNYDNKSSPPSFDLHFNGNKRTTVVTSSEELVSKVSIYNVKVDAISVCLAQTHPNQLPFISALEVRSLASTM